MPDIATPQPAGLLTDVPGGEAGQGPGLGGHNCLGCNQITHQTRADIPGARRPRADQQRQGRDSVMPHVPCVLVGFGEHIILNFGQQ